MEVEIKRFGRRRCGSCAQQVDLQVGGWCIIVFEVAGMERFALGAGLQDF